MNPRLPLLLLGAALPALAADFDPAPAINQVGLDLYRQLAAEKPGENLVLSPYSIETALALAYAGAEGATRAEMAKVLRFPADDSALVDGFRHLRRALSSAAEHSKTVARQREQHGGRVDPIEWHAANRLFGQEGYAFRDPFLTLMKDGFEAPFQPMDFARQADRARSTINGWVEDQTRRRIKDLIPAGALKTDTRLVLVNALYLKAAWEKAFESRATQDQPFHSAPGATSNVPTMQRTAHLGYAAEDGATIVTLDYLGSALQFVIVLPAAEGSVDALARRLTPEHFARWSKLGERNRQHVSLYLPRFKVESSTLRLGAALRGLGVKSAFDEPSGTANFDRIAPRKPEDYLAISDVFHRTFIAVDEQGTEAAAATAVQMVTLAAMMEPQRPIDVRVDRPFLFAIQHRASGACLFLGRICDPR